MVEAVDRKHSFPALRPSADRSSSSYSSVNPTSPIADPRATPALLRDSGRPGRSSSDVTTDVARDDNETLPQTPKLPVQDSVPGSAKSKGKTPVRRGDAVIEPKKSPITDVVSEELRSLLRREPLKIGVTIPK